MNYSIIGLLFWGFIAYALFTAFVAVPQGNVYVSTIFGKFYRILKPGLTLKIPVLESIYKRISIQNRSNELSFQAITIDQANVYFKTLLIYCVLDDEEETIQNVAFKFMNEQNFNQSLFRSIEGTIRSFVAIKKQEEVLSLREEIVRHVKQELDGTLAEWGFKLLDLQINEIQFDEAISKSMAEVVASNNLLQAAHNQGESIRIIKVKEAEAEREASKLRGQGTALFREEVARGISKAAKEIKAADLDPSFVLFSMWLESMRYIAKEGKGNLLFFDGSNSGQKQTIKELMAMRTFPLSTDVSEESKKEFSMNTGLE
ncbi:MAG: SPFH domain-containing protein [Saprospiraceae bacterium]|nr:SPFH domain-containing protein [Saprospiraceae bacterium]MDZ7880153.1 SPFH domain-containing protein [Saprospiraceae bacterium]